MQKISLANKRRQKKKNMALNAHIVLAIMTNAG